MSNIPRARELLRQALNEGMIDVTSRRILHRALKLMTREPAIRRRVRHRPIKITPKLREKIVDLLDSDMTMHQIATLVGVNNSGRISEVAHGKR